MRQGKMVEKKDVCSSSVKTPKLQLADKQPSTGECWIPPKKDSPHPRQKRRPNKTVGAAKSHLESNLILPRDSQRVQTKPCVQQGPGKGKMTPTRH